MSEKTDNPGYVRIVHAVNFTEKVEGATRLMMNQVPECYQI